MYEVQLTFSPSIIVFYDLVDVTDVLEPLSLYLPNLVRVSALIRSEKQQVQYHCLGNVR